MAAEQTEAQPAAPETAETPTPIPPQTAPAQSAQMQPAGASGMSGITSLASTFKGSAPDTDPEPIEWGDMDPNWREALQKSPELQKGIQHRSQAKEDGLLPRTFPPTTLTFSRLV
ncbi:unnamed protein product [Symbiodinium sp. CCMP2592]|nr:unnamed protein product [Symbiodinium sp. CCMP2592]